MNKRVYKTLEFDKILSLLSRHASCEAAVSMCEKLEPLTNIEEIRTAQIQTTDAVRRLRKKAGPRFNMLVDIRPSLKRLEVGGILNTVDLLEIGGLLDCAVSAVNFLKPENGEEAPDSLSSYYEAIDPCVSLNKEIKRCILSYDEIADDASSVLRQIRRRIADTKASIQRTLNRIITSADMKTYLQDSVVTMRNGRYCIPVRQELRAGVPGMIHDQSGSGSTVFIEPAAVVDLNNRLKELDLEEKAEIQVILAGLSEAAGGVSQSLLADHRLLTGLDLILAKARFSEALKGNAPDFNEDGYIELKQARHPLLDINSAVPINISLGKDFNMLIITGPNTGGKTVSLKTAGLLCLMGQAGLHIPALDGSSLCIFDEIYADIGDEQSIEQSLSTFSSHMTNVVDILDKADSSSLVLLDELCSGTDPTEGAALAQAILTRLNHYGCKVMATTHYPELKVFAMSTEGVSNACCEFDVETLRPTYKLIIGLPGKSNAFAISEKLGLENDIIEKAKERLDAGSIAFEDILSDIEADRKTAGRERAEAERLRIEAEGLRSSLEKDKEALNRKKEETLRKANEEAYEVLSQAKAYADRTIKDIRKAEKGRVELSALERTRTEIGKKANASLAELSFKPKAAKSSRSFSADDLKEGDKVHVNSVNLDGIITQSADSKGMVGVMLGNMNMKVRLSDLDEPHEQSYEKNSAPEKAGGIGNIRYNKAMGISHELKLLGMTVDDALIELSKYLDDASMAHLEKVRIVHGKGTGALRSAVRQYLKREKRVKKFYQAEYGEGDAGVTIAELK